MDATADRLELDRQNISADLLLKGSGRGQRTEIAILPEPEPRPKGIVTRTEHLCTARSERSQLPVSPCAPHEECGLGLIELACDPSHLVIGQVVGVLYHGQRIARQRHIRKYIDETCNQFNHFVPRLG